MESEHREFEAAVKRAKRKRAIVIRYQLTEEEKTKLRKAARDLSYKGIRQLLYHRGLADLWD